MQPSSHLKFEKSLLRISIIEKNQFYLSQSYQPKFFFTLKTIKTFLIRFFRKFHLKKKKVIYKIQVFLSKIDVKKVPFKSDINPSLLQDKTRLVNTQKILYFFYKKLNSIIKELIRTESKLVKSKHNFSQKNLAFKKQIFFKNYI